MKASEDAQFVKLMGQYAEANYKLGANQNKGRPQAEDITRLEHARDDFLKYADTVTT